MSVLRYVTESNHGANIALWTWLAISLLSMSMCGLIVSSLQVLLEDDQAVGVQYIQDDRVRTVRARKEVILSAGAVGSAHLLMLSGIGPRRHLEANKVF